MFSLRVLEVLAWCHIFVGRVLAWIYAKAWGRKRLGWFDHRFDFLRGPQFWYWQERGILGSQAIPRGAKVLDLCCGEGFYDRIYFAARAGKIDALDRDQVAVREAMAWNSNPSVNFYVGDVAQDPFPDSGYDVVLCFSALQQMGILELNTLLPKIQATLKRRGIFFGSVSLIPQNRVLHCEQDVNALLERYFASVRVNSSSWFGGRVECYFTCCATTEEMSAVQDIPAKS
jgi:ubiquinone/menaquinone biosynthesis C-methylase UbiE